MKAPGYKRFPLVTCIAWSLHLHLHVSKLLFNLRCGSGEKLMLTIQFERVGTKKIIAKYASLEIIGG